MTTERNNATAAETGETPIRRVMWGREERPLTVFVPWDCGCNCPFCTTKREYEETYPRERLDRNFRRLKESVRRMLAYGFVGEVVLTGGEPLADCARLDELARLVKRSHGEDAEIPRLYVNTSLDLDPPGEAAAADWLVRNCGTLVDGISVSLPFADAKAANRKRFAALGRLLRACGEPPFDWVRVNSVVAGNETAGRIRTFLRDVRNLEEETGRLIWAVCFRKNYSECDQSNLNDCFDPFLRTLLSMPDLLYQGHGGCLVCRNDVFWPDGDLMHRVVYHRGTERTGLRFGDFLVVNDFVVKQDGEIRYDWTAGTALPKRAMDALAEKRVSPEDEWKWKNGDFARTLSVGGHAWGTTCRDHGPERCG